MDYTSAYSDPNLYNDGSGRGAVINPPIAQPMTGQMNMSSLRPGGGMPGAVPPGFMPQQPMQGMGMGMRAAAGYGQEEEVVEEDYLSGLFDGENLSELMQEQTQAAKEVIEEATSSSTENLVEHLDQYLNYVINEWMTENQVAIERGLRTELAENFINQLKDLFESSFIDVPDEKYNILDDMYGANSELQEALNSTIAENMQLRNEITARLCAEAFIEQTSDLADTEIEKLASLAEGIEFDSVNQYKQKVAILKETYFNGNSSNINESTNRTYLSENVGSYVSTDSSNTIMDSVVGAISAMQRNKPKATQNSERLTSLINPGIVQDNFI